MHDGLHLWYFVFVLVAGLVSGAIFVIALVVTARRRSTPYVLLTAAIGALVARSTVAILDLIGLVSFRVHHVAEHGLDAVIALCLLGAIVSMRSPRDLA